MYRCISILLQPLLPRCFGPNYAEKHRRMGPGGCFCHSENVPQDVDSAGAAGAAHSCRHPAPYAGPRNPLQFLPSTTQQQKQKMIQAGPLRRHPAANLPSRPEILTDPKTKESVVAPATHLSCRGEMGVERLPAQSVPPFVSTQACCGDPWQGGALSVGPI